MSTLVEEFALEGEIAEISGHLNAQHARLVRLVAQAQRDGGWFGEGYLSLPHWLTVQVGLSPGRAKQIDTIASRVDELPLLLAAFDRGELSIDQVYTVANKAPAWADAKVTEFAKYATVRQLQHVIRDEYFDDDPDAPKPEARPRDESMSLSWDEHGRLRISGSLDAEQGAVLEAAVNEAKDSLYTSGDTTATWADALAEIGRRSLAGVAGGRRQRFKTWIHINTNGNTQLTNGIPLPSGLRDYLLCDTNIQPVWERDNIPFGVGRSQRIVPDRTRRLIEYRDRGCRVPGCTCTHVEIHHIIHWTNGGVTETWNLISLCPKHHKLHHLGKLTIAGNADQPDGVVFTDQHGRLLATHPTPTPPDEPPAAPSVEYRHPSGERLQAQWIDWAHPKALEHRRQLADEHHRRQQLE